MGKIRLKVVGDEALEQKQKEKAKKERNLRQEGITKENLLKNYCEEK